MQSAEAHSVTPSVHQPEWGVLRTNLRGDLRLSLHDRLLYSTDASIYQVEPLGVLIPDDVADIQAALEHCQDHRIAVLPRGGGTSLSGQCTARALVIDASSALLDVRDHDPIQKTVYAQAGVTLDDVNEQLAGTGQFFAPDPSTSRQATVGGCIGNNAAGSRSVLYGRTSDNIAAIDALLADGTRVLFDEGAAMRDARVAAITTGVVDVIRRHEQLIRDRFPRTVRRSAGYQLDVILQQLDAHGGDLARVNLAPLLCGSEGTLAYTVGATLKLHPVPRAKGLAVIAFDDLDKAIAAVLPLLERHPAAVELLDDIIIDLARKNPGQRKNVDVLPAPPGVNVRAVLYVELFDDAVSDDPFGDVERRLALIRDEFGADWVATHTDPATMTGAWALRKAGEPLLHGVPGHRKPLGFVEDNAVPPERLAEFVRRFRDIVTKHGTIASFYAHASVGVLHVRPMLDLRDDADRERVRSIAVEVAALAKELGGVMSGEHGDGRVRGPLLPDYFGPELIEAFRAVKAIFDPGGILNPGNIVDPQPIATITEKTRVQPEADPVGIGEVKTYYRYDDQGDFAHAVEMCNGAGVCRKKTGGTMCPSYMGTLDERHSTRGRGNALRLAISGQLNKLSPGSASWGDAGTGETLNLCLSCKACKAECPSNVDIARLKAEYQAQSYAAAERVPLRALAFGHVDLLNRVASLTPKLATAVNKTKPAKWLLRKLLNVDQRRDLPAWTRSLKSKWPKDAEHLPGDAPRVVFLADTFTIHNEPQIGLAAKRVLEALGYRVVPYWGTDFGRALMSTGLLPQAIKDAEGLLDRLRPMIDDDSIAGFVMTEPSCLSSVLDDWLLLDIDRPLALRQRLADRTAMVEDFLHANWDRHPTRPEMRTDAVDRVLFHGHCHQKAVVGPHSSADLLKRLLGDRVEVLDAGCCGMAGSFGYTADRYDLSMKIGAMRLFPAIKNAPHAVPVATGTSCRHQIKDGTGRDALHPLEVIERMVT
jgi:FAD/FMN-containing dehydrogenase/Fe-S oxidoreductase